MVPPTRVYGFVKRVCCWQVCFFWQIVVAGLIAWSPRVVAGGAGGMGNVVYDPMNHVQTTI